MIRCGYSRWPKCRVRLKLQKPEYRARYEEHCRRRGLVAIYNLDGCLVRVIPEGMS